MIKEKHNEFQSINANAISLWRSSIPLDNNLGEVLKHFKGEENVSNDFRIMYSTKLILTYFPDGYKPVEDNLHVIAKPLIGESKKCTKLNLSNLFFIS